MKRYILYGLSAVVALSAAADVISPARALERVRDMAAVPSRVASLRGGSAVEPMLTVDAADGSGQAAVYVFSSRDKSGGYMVLSADDEARPLLGYADAGPCDADDMPSNMKAWLDFYAEEIAAMRAAGDDDSTGKYMAVGRPQRDPVAPLVSAAWNQDAPYNDKCPKIGGQPTMTGCVATAMAQVLSVYRYPDRCSGGTFSYHQDDAGIDVSLDFDEVTLNWDAMIDSYAGGVGTAVQKDAVATLMNAVGVCAKMNYGTGMSGAYGSELAVGLVRNFGYSPSLRLMRREWFDLISWENMIYSDLKAGHPVYYDGVNGSNTGAHAFVVDGYSSDGFFHLNWGWGGMSNGYFTLTALDPASQGIGGSSSGYNFSQNIITGMRPDDGSYDRGTLDFRATGALTASVAGTVVGNSVTFGGGSYNCSPVEVPEVTFGIRFTGADGSVTYADGSGPYDGVQTDYGVSSYEVTVPSSLSDGTYVLNAVVKNARGEYFDVRAPIGRYGELYATVANRRIRFVTPSYATLECEFQELPGTVYAGASFPTTLSMVNVSDSYFYGGVSCCLVSVDDSDNSLSLVATLSRVPAELASDDTYECRTLCDVPASVAPGSYYMIVINDRGLVMSDIYPVEVEENPGAPVLSASSFRVVDTARDNLRFSFSLRCTSGYNSSPVYVYIFDQDGSSSLCGFSSDPVYLESGGRQSVTVSGRFDNGEVGRAYLAVLFYMKDGGFAQLLSPVRFVLGDDVNSAIVSPATVVVGPEGQQDEDAGVYFDMNGRRIASPVAGLYFRRVADGTVQKVLLK